MHSFAEIAAQPDYRIDLARAALLIAQDEYPDLNVRSYLKKLDSFAAAVAEQIPSEPDPWVHVNAINDFLFRQRHFHGNVSNYYDPRNSYLNDVIDRRIGIPITLSLIYIEIAKRLKLPIYGVNLPGHFIVGYFVPGLELFIDPFNSGRVLTSEDCHEIVLQTFQNRSSSCGDYLRPVSSRVILTRMLTNLKFIHYNQGDVSRAIRVLNRIIILNPNTSLEYKERGMLHLAEKRYRAALCDLMHYLNNAPNAPDIDIIRDQIELVLLDMEKQK